MNHANLYESPKAGGRQLRTMATLLPYLWPAGNWPMRRRVVFAFALMIASRIANVYVPLFYKDAMDMLTGETNLVIALPLGLLFAYGATRVLAVGFAELREAVFARVAQRAVRAAALRTFEHLHALGLRFHLDRQTGGLSRVIERGVKGIEFVLAFTMFNILPTLLEILLVCAILWNLFDVWYALVTFVTIVSYIGFTLVITEWRIAHRREMNNRDTEANTKAIDSLLNYETVKYFGNEAHEARRYDGAMRGYEEAAVRNTISLSALNVGQAGIIAAGLVLVTVMAGNDVVAGTMTIGDFVLVNAYLIQLYLPLNFLGFVYRQIRQSLTDMEVMFNILDIPAEITDAPAAPPLRITGGEVVFDHVDFGYDERRPILRDVSFTVPPGRTVAIVGPSGAGKSTLSRILFRFYDVTGGSVKIDGQDIRKVTQESLRAAIGIVPQDTVLFNDSIYYNILYGRTGASRAQVEEAARLARIHDFIIALPDGYRTGVGERGLKLSGGEKQRVAIARTILKQPAILLFDEATSALDTHTEKEIQESLREVSSDRSTLVIAHRLSTVIDADEILVLDHGRIVERGRHADLLERGGAYAAMWAKQQETLEDVEAD
ncbi:MAG: ATM1-type heavy metal exporter [Alphaproteobacteria bacterium MarineAlpha10_Bin3]|nr:MAG: ATM1-type heavy metal exporter [Alphaproteobacteria bacterium MarineAlpha10_Bin3]PPR73584.1 MAG: ATM1-type heavy metal exporter [Alphaproteobacteria bacterium MarineAlpha4_Bin1]